MTNSKYEINDTALIRHVPLIRNVPADIDFIQNDLVITKEEFIACYNKWIKPKDDTQNDIKKSEDQ